MPTVCVAAMNTKRKVYRCMSYHFLKMIAKRGRKKWVDFVKQKRVKQPSKHLGIRALRARSNSPAVDRAPFDAGRVCVQDTSKPKISSLERDLNPMIVLH